MPARNTGFDVMKFSYDEKNQILHFNDEELWLNESLRLFLERAIADARYADFSLEQKRKGFGITKRKVVPYGKA